MLYRNGMFAVTCFTAISVAAVLFAVCFASSTLAAQVTPQYGHKQAVDKGPRALGIVQLSPKGAKGRLIPIAVMIDGKFYDAGSYKASPVPMALDFGVVYEGFRAGVSQGVFTITQPGQLNHVWMAEGTWLPAGAVDPRQPKKYSTPVIADDDKDGPPVLHRRQGSSDADSASDSKEKDKDKDKAKEDQPKPVTAAAPPAPPTSGAPVPSDTTKAPPAAEPAKPPAPSPAPVHTDDENIADPNRPRLRHSKPVPTAHQEPYATFDPLTDETSGAPAVASSGAGKADAAASAAAAPQIALMPVISDAAGPDPRPYVYDVKPIEETLYRSKMLDLAASLLHPNAPAKGTAPASKKTAAGKSAAKLSTPAFDDVNLRIFDLSNSNEPVLVLSAKTHPPSTATGSIEEPKEIMLIARTNLEGDLLKLFFSQTDSRHLDVTPRMELIDAVDADGDGRGELLFRRTFDAGSAYAIYRVAADRLWPLFEGTP